MLRVLSLPAPFDEHRDMTLFISQLASDAACELKQSPAERRRFGCGVACSPSRSAGGLTAHKANGVGTRGPRPHCEQIQDLSAETTGCQRESRPIRATADRSIMDPDPQVEPFQRVRPHGEPDLAALGEGLSTPARSTYTAAETVPDKEGRRTRTSAATLQGVNETGVPESMARLPSRLRPPWATHPRPRGAGAAPQPRRAGPDARE
jgi:hypothetical protein